MQDNKKIDFEASLKQLEEIVNKIENQTLPLDESIALYEQGKTIIDQLEQALKEAEEKINKLAK
ncbi:MAG: exodeoxyribonuclease VII small subunit [Bacillales bacterium]|nr:exodeoxyribonuclease VII small subunit [Bacillales bacterium]